MVKIKNITPDGFKRLKSEFEEKNLGRQNAGKVYFGDGDWEWVELGLTMLDADFLQQRRFSVEAVARWFGVPPQMIGVQDKQTLNNYEQAALQFHQLAVLPWVVRFEQEVNRKLLNVASGRRPFLKINTAAIVRANLEAQYRAFALGRQWGWLSVNDVRRLIDAEPIGPEGDVYLQPLNMEPSSDAIVFDRDGYGNITAVRVGDDQRIGIATMAGA
jgi:HK97 family phage portal protein